MVVARKREPAIQGEKGLRGGRYIGTAGEGVERATLSSRGEKRPWDRVGNTRAQGGSFTPVPKTRQCVHSGNVRPRVEDSGGKGTKAKVEDGNPTKILTPIRQSARRADVRPIGKVGGGKRTRPGNSVSSG